jgi:hypothetical protein
MSPIVELSFIDHRIAPTCSHFVQLAASWYYEWQDLSGVVMFVTTWFHIFGESGVSDVKVNNTDNKTVSRVYNFPTMCNNSFALRA